MAAWFEGFEARDFDVDGVRIHARIGGNPAGPPVLLLHGFPQTHAIWHRVARPLAPTHFLVLPDLRGYGDSALPPGGPDHANYSKRAMAADMLALMAALGHGRFDLVGHDRGARVAHRLALDAPAAVRSLALLDIAPTLDMYETTDVRFATAYHHWFHLIQPHPLPERMIEGCAKFYLHALLGGWRSADPADADASAPRGGAAGSGRPGAGRGPVFIEPEALAEYERCFCRSEAIHAACEDYRASAGIDLEHDRASRAAGQKIACDTLLLWGAHGVVGRLFEPLSLWRAQCAGRMHGQAVAAGHFIPEELPEVTLAALREHWAAGPDAKR